MSKFVGTGPSSYEKRIYLAAVSQSLRNTGIDNPQVNVVWSTLRIARLYLPRPPKTKPRYSFLLQAESTPGHTTAGTIKSMNNSNYTIGNRNRDLAACGAVPQPTAPPRGLPFINKFLYNSATQELIKPNTGIHTVFLKYVLIFPQVKFAQIASLSLTSFYCKRKPPTIR
jgi:hypothetical protein